MSVTNWQSFIDTNRPAALRLIDSNQREQFVVITEIRGTEANLLHRGGTETVPLIEIGQWWTGEFAFLWQGPQNYVKPVALNHQGDITQWIASRFSTLDKQEKSLADKTFNAALSQRVKLFQQSHSLEADGIVGLRTLLKLNESLGVAITLSPTDNNTGEG